MKVTTLDERVIQDIGYAFGYYDYGPEHGLIDTFPSRDAQLRQTRCLIRPDPLSAHLKCMSFPPVKSRPHRGRLFVVKKQWKGLKNHVVYAIIGIHARKEDSI